MSGLSKYTTKDFTFDHYSPCFQIPVFGWGWGGRLNNIDETFLKSYPGILMAWKIIQYHIK